MTITQPPTPPRRRWLQFSLRTMLCLITGFALVLGWPHVRRYYVCWRLQQHAGKYLRQLPDNERRRVDDWISVIVKPKMDEPFARLTTENWLIHTAYEPQVGSRLYIVQMVPLSSPAGTSYCNIHVVDRWGRPIRCMKFNIGKRASPEFAGCDASRYPFLCLAVETVFGWGRTRQFYRITDSQVELLRSELDDGTFAMGRGEYGNIFEIEDKPPDWSDWKRLLASDSVVDQLRGLAAFFSHDNRERRTLMDDKTRLRFEQISKSRDSWISEEARAALSLIDKRRPE